MNRKIFFDLYKKQLDKDKKLTDKEVKNIDIFLNFFERDFKMYSVSQWAYVFATAFHETAHTFEPNREAYWLSESWRKKNLRYYPWYGRGYCHITWDFNYTAYGKKLKIDLKNNPDLALKPEYAWFIMVDGFKYGTFTGKKITDYINNKEENFKGARRCINGTDKADLIASYAKTFKEILKKSIDG